MKVQRYNITLRLQPGDLAKPGQMVFKDNESSEVSGFVVGVTGDIADIILFTSTDMTGDDIPNAVVTRESMTDDEVERVFLETLVNADERVQEDWRSSLHKQIIHEEQCKSSQETT